MFSECEEFNHSNDFIHNYLMDNSCDIICLQETWTIDYNINILGNNHNDFIFTGISGVDHTVHILVSNHLFMLWTIHQ